MATKQANTTEAVVQVVAEAARAVLQAMAMANADNDQRAQSVGPKLGGPIIKQLTFDWTPTDRSAELRNFK